MQFIRQLLLPFSWIYAMVVWLRNQLFNWGVLRGEKGVLPTVVIGNVHAGGTGKSPHTLKLASLLENEISLAILSRGYGRKSNGFLAWKEGMNSAQFGDEPLQYAHRLSRTAVAVCENRVEGIKELKKRNHFDLVILDDAFQHRKLIGDLNIVLMRECELPQHSKYLPTGNLRDHLLRLKDADVIIVTGVSKFWSKSQQEDLRSALSLPKHCLITSSKIIYASPRNGRNEETMIPSQPIVLTGIAHPSVFVNYIKANADVIRHFEYNDHYAFSTTDYNDWKKELNSRAGSRLITTEKDFMRIDLDQFDPDFLSYIPISIEIDNESAILELVKAVYSPKK